MAVQVRAVLAVSCDPISRSTLCAALAWTTLCNHIPDQVASRGSPDLEMKEYHVRVHFMTFHGTDDEVSY